MVAEMNKKIDEIWLLLVAVHVLMMQLGFILIEVGFIRAKNTRTVIFKNLVDAFLVALIWYVIGYGYLHGGEGGIIGSGGMLDLNFEDSDYITWVISYTFCATTCTAISGALAERTFMDTYLCFTFLMAAIIYPVIASWAWGGGWL